MYRRNFFKGKEVYWGSIKTQKVDKDKENKKSVKRQDYFEINTITLGDYKEEELFITSDPLCYWTTSLVHFSYWLYEI